MAPCQVIDYRPCERGFASGSAAAIVGSLFQCERGVPGADGTPAMAEVDVGGRRREHTSLPNHHPMTALTW